MRTYRISEEEIKGMTPVATGYKIFPNDFVAHGYDYKDENGNVVGTIHKVDGDIEQCRWGLHFSKLPHDCFNFYEPLQWNKFAKIEAYDKVINCDKKSVTNILKIVAVLSFDEFIDLCQKELQNGITGGNNIWGGNNITGGNYIRGGNYIWGGNNIWGGNDIRGGNYIWGGNNIWGGNYIWGALNCEGISRSIFCYNKSGKLMAFNKKINEDRFYEIYNRLIAFGWYPKFNNAETLKGNLEWYETNIPAIVLVDNKTAWSFMPTEMKEYIQSLPEYNEKIFNKITGDID
nr:MAG TPA: hypothetical protein [Caudoviricetes sp.]